MDKEDQKDEMTALESIYSKEEFSYAVVDDHYEFTSKICLNLPEGYYFTYKDNKNEETRRKIQISHLPPLVLRVTLPKDYPSVSPPKFVLRSLWLEPAFLGKLCKELDRLWKANEGQQILFTWINFLQMEILEFLHIEEFVDISFAQRHNSNNGESKERRFAESNNDKEKQDNSDDRAVFDFLYDANLVEMLMDYNDKRSELEFKKNFFTCYICFVDRSGEHCIKFKPCAHVFCKECVAGYFETKIQEGAVKNIYCPGDECESEVFPNQIKDLVSPELFERYDTLLLNTTLDTMTDIIYCPRQICQYPAIKEPWGDKENEKMAYCPMCHFAFCIHCKAVYHGVEPCKSKTDLLKTYAEASPEEKLALERQYGEEVFENLLHKEMTENWIQNNTRLCPSCCVSIQKSEGCNKMTCWKCHTYFCWICKKILWRTDPYRHFRTPGTPCYNQLTEDVEINFEEDYVGIYDDTNYNDYE